MSRILFRILAVTAFALTLSSSIFFGASASARSTLAPHRTWCAWAPGHPEVCAARRFCPADPRDPRCAVYCHVNPRDVVCGDVYQPQLPPTSPWYGDSPYPWARSGGGFCDQNPGNIACQNDWDLLSEPYQGQY